MASDPEQWTCPKCGATMHPRKCRGHSKRTGKHCGDWAAEGLTVCRRHGGAAPQVRAVGERRREEAAAQRAVATYGLPVEVDPLNALLGELYRTAGHVAWLGALIADLDHDDSTSGLKQYERDKGPLWEKPSVWVELYQRERQHLAKVARDCLSAGIEERRVKLAEDQGRLLADVMRRTVAALGHDPAAPDVREVMRRELTVVAGHGA